MTPEPEVSARPVPTWRRRLAWPFVDRAGTLRSGWAILLFLGCVAIVLWVAGKTLYQTHLVPSAGDVPLDDPWAIPDGFVRVLVLLVPTVVGCVLVRQRLGAAYLGDRAWARRLGFGLLAGIGIISGTALLAAVLGSSGFRLFELPAGEVAWSIAMQTAVLAPASIAEELALRGFLFQQLVRGLGRILAVGITAIAFGLLHLGNPEVARLAVVNIILVGVLFGVVTLRTGSLWIAAGMHVGWNIFQGGVWGSPVSGIDTGLSLLESTATRATLWNGGAFGYEASLSNTVMLVIACALGFLLPVRSARAAEPVASARAEDAPVLEPAEPPETSEPPPV